MASAAAALRPRIRLVGTALAAGVVAAVVALLLLGVASGDPRFATRKAFGLGAVVFGFALLGWSGVLLGGEGYEAMQDHLDTGTDFTKEGARRAMARIAGFGAGWMVTTAVVDAALT